ncbi:MAG: HAD family hydrolase [Candidatus Magasanikbacteria bacterium]|jgi:phosphoglycolate phosphatase|nr:HAD family hydrolase [Candidatus Magasanikbacteria bacterium]MBT4071664.1 HAD family hydrolase [Candidatus Magasanikbacteria bacterium]
MKTLIFDFDGVIHDTFEFHRGNINELFGVDVSMQEYKDMHNGNFFSDFPDMLKDVNWNEYGDYITAKHSLLKIEQGIKDFFIKLYDKHDLHIVSSGSRFRIEEYLENQKMSHVFKEVLGKEDSLSKVVKFSMIFDKYNLTSDECMFITDTLGDIIEGNEANIKTIAVDFGFHDRALLEKGNPYKIISDFNELFDILAE